MVQLIKRYEDDIDLLYLKVDKDYQIVRTIDAGDMILDFDKDNKLVAVELLQASKILNISSDILKEDFDVKVKVRSERSDVIADASFSFIIDGKDVARHVHAKTTVPDISISNQNLKLIEKT